MTAQKPLETRLTPEEMIAARAAGYKKWREKQKAQREAEKKEEIKEEIKTETGVLKRSSGENTREDMQALLRELEEEQAFRLEREKFRFYEPNGKCEEYIKQIGTPGNFIILFSAANGVGKTCVSANVVAHLIWGRDSENRYFDYPVYKDFPFPKKGRIVSDPKNIEANLIPTLKEWFPDGRYRTNKSGKHYDANWICDNGFEFDIMTYEQDVKEFESATLGWAWFDEPPPMAIFKATVARMRKGGIIFISETPLYAAWLYDHIIANPDKTLTESGQRIFLEADVESACKQHGIRGHLEHDHIQRITAEYSEEEKQARIYGKFQHLIGLRFKQFTRNIHVVKPFPVGLRDFTVYEALDPHPRTNDAVTWIAVDRQGRKFIIDELWQKCQGGTPELAERIKNKASQYRIQRRIIDPSAFIEDQHTRQCLQRSLSALGLHYFEASKMRAVSDRKIEDALTYQKISLADHEEFVVAPDLYIFDTCHYTIYEFEHYRWSEWTGKNAGERDVKEKTVDKDDHMIENIGRILIQEPKFIELPFGDNQGAAPEPDYDPYN
jgi:phage terminase large subunit-like protein